jgi:hypothetical protein
MAGSEPFASRNPFTSNALDTSIQAVLQSPVAATRKNELTAIEPVFGQHLLVDGEREC